MTTITSIEWQQFLAGHTEAHILQTAEWGRLKSAFGWSAQPIVQSDTGALILFKKLPLGFSAGYIPKGPVGGDWDKLWPEVDQLCKQKRAIFLKVEPDSSNETGTAAQSLEKNGFVRVTRTIQPGRSIIINLQGNEEDWLARMKQKTRYNIRLAQKKEIVVQPSRDIAEFYSLMQVTGSRDGFGVHSQAYYQMAYDIFKPLGQCELLVARYQDMTVAALMVFTHGERSWYLYGASSDAERNRMPTYLLQWEAMRWAASRGCHEYDLWGVPDEDEETLEAQFSNRYDGLWGVYRFKRGYGGAIVRSVGAFDRVYIPVLYRLYQFISSRREI